MGSIGKKGNSKLNFFMTEHLFTVPSNKVPLLSQYNLKYKERYFLPARINKSYPLALRSWLNFKIFSIGFLSQDYH
jgi:hypothetical protein